MKRAIVAGCLAGLVAGCASMGMGGGGATAVADLAPTTGSSAGGKVTFTQEGDGVRVNANVTGLKPGAEHGFHVHEKGDCSSGDGMSTGGHWNPDSTPHGPQAAPHHAGDMPSLVADAGGNAKASFSLDGVTVAPGPKSVVGRGLIVHKDPDDFKTQPTGNAGARVACAVIQAQ